MSIELPVPNELLHRLDILAAVLEKNRSEILVDALRSYLLIVTSDDEYIDQIVDTYNEDMISDEELRLLFDEIDMETFQALKQQLGEEDVSRF